MKDLGHDPVRDFFDREREQIVPQPGDDLHWQSVVRQGRARRRFRFAGYAAGMTAAGLVLGSVAYGGFPHNGTVLVPAAASGTRSAPSAPPGSTVTVSAERPASAIDALLPEPTRPEQRTLWEAQRKLIRQCMLDQGINFTFPAWEVNGARDADGIRREAAVSTAKSAFANPTWAKAHGYGFNAEVFRAAPAVTQGPGGGPRLDAKTAAALDGNGPGATIDLPDGMGRLSYSTNGCQADATRQIYGDLRQFYALGQTTTQVHNLNEVVSSAPAVSGSLQKWRQCMSAQGWASFREQPDAFGKVYDAYSSRRPDARELEFSIAPADAGCTLSSGYGAAVKAAQDRAVGSVSPIMARRITAFLELRRRALDVATTVLKR